MNLYIPIISDFIHYFIKEDIFEYYCFLNLIISGILFFYFLKKPLEYGRFNNSKNTKSEFSSKYAFMIIHLIPLIIYILFLFLYDDLLNLIPPLSPPSIIWIIYNLYNGLIYPFLRPRYASLFPLKSIIIFTLINTSFSLISAKIYMSSNYRFNFLKDLIRIILILICIILNYFHQSHLKTLRFKNVRGYKIPKFGLFNYISNPSHLLDMIIKLIWLTFYHFDLNTSTLILWILVIHYVRAEALHKWYKKTYKTEYSNKKTAIIPFLNISTIINLFIGTFEYGGL